MEDALAANSDLIEGPHRAIVEFLRPITAQAKVTVRVTRHSKALALWLVVDGEDVAATATVQALVFVFGVWMGVYVRHLRGAP
ncbi:hypothetical protein [Nocardia sp. NPDC059239]|uniref:hypothetical protein n=1 Tax=Nocardia sp. NPDC059239 TaxID=3346785 RepID=UPI00367AA202